MDSSSPLPPKSGFPETQWATICLAAHGSEEQRREALQALCLTYRLPLYTFLRSLGRGHEVAEDTVQEFYLRLTNGRLLSLATPEKGRFRTLLLKAIKNLDQDLQRGDQAQKRGGDMEMMSLDHPAVLERLQDELIQHLSPEKVFDRAWANVLIDRTRVRLQQHYTTLGKVALFAELFPRIAGDKSATDFLADTATRLEMSEAAVKTAFWRMRQLYGEIFRDEVRQTVVSQEDIEDEVRRLMASFS
ncbi:RNA polymerase sigma-70 factor, ECF subfamily [Prosthecobacter debontii]|uniref:RNA polymerase sigma-70 factor, ECF subfamily n=1 Tax=Prosthecobacter debontii TaxID=48467 RepID=A0A1T4XBX7_9BACT|nr:hypothetical protein [Prosthecobacter debontii]SKA86675.1 RNA polymerase sigma-70 factor, ECF subfamily [Prosthecobacter debontii]